MNKKLREKVYLKYDKHCAYCGKELLSIKDMQVDHLKPKRNGGTDDFENLMPACRRCTHYKRAHSLECFRDMLNDLQKKIMKDVSNKFQLVSSAWVGDYIQVKLLDELPKHFDLTPKMKLTASESMDKSIKKMKDGEFLESLVHYTVNTSIPGNMQVDRKRIILDILDLLTKHFTFERKEIDQELKQCPACGGQAKYATRDIDMPIRHGCLSYGLNTHVVTMHFIKCTKKECLSTSLFDTKEEAIEVWNKGV